MGGSSLLLLILLAESVPSGEPPCPVRIATSGELPFSVEELQRALLARLPPDPPAGTLIISRRPDDLLEISWQSLKRAVDVSAEHDASAARVVALLAADLFTPLQPPSMPAPARAPSTAGRLLPDPADKSDGQSTTRLAGGYQVLAGGEPGLVLQGWALAAERDSRRLRLRVSAGRLTSPTQNLLSATAWPVHLQMGVGTSYLSLLVGLAMVPYELRGIVEVTRLMAGTSADLQGRFPIAKGFSLQALAGCDLFLSRGQRVQAGEVTLFHTPRLAVHVELALAWEIPR